MKKSLKSTDINDSNVIETITLNHKSESEKKITVPIILARKNKFEKINCDKIVCVTAYDFLTAQIIEESEAIDIILVGDSLGMIHQGHSNTLSVTMDDIIYHAKGVVRGAKRALIVADMPFMSFSVSSKSALKFAGKLIKESGVSAVKIEGGKLMHNTVKRIVNAGIPVVGHIGLTPQSFNIMGGYKIQGDFSSNDKTHKNNQPKKSMELVIEDAIAIQDAGAFALVLEAIPETVSKQITEVLDIPTIGIGAGKYCDGQILVLHDLLGLNEKVPKFVKKYANLRETIKDSLRLYSKETKESLFPDKTNSYTQRN